MKKILIVTPYSGRMGGVETVTQALAEVLRQKGFVVDFLTADEGPRNIFEVIMVKLKGLSYLTKNKFKKIQGAQYKAVICNGEFAEGINHPKVISYFHGSYHGLRLSTEERITFLNRLVLKIRSRQQVAASSHTKVVAVSQYLKGILNEQGIKVDYVIGNPIDLKHFAPALNRPRSGLAFFGRYDYWGKGFDYLEKLSASGLPVICYTDSKEKTALNIQGMIAHEKLPEVMNNYKFLISPSRFESFGMTVAEGLSCGLPVLMGKTGIASELKQTLPEFVVDDFSNIEEVKRKILHIEENYNELSKKARLYAEEHFSLEKFVNDWMKVINA